MGPMNLLLGQTTKIKEVILNQENNQEFMTNLRHKLRTPMTVIKGYLAMARDSKEGEVSDEVKKYLEEAYTANEEALKMVEDIR